MEIPNFGDLIHIGNTHLEENGEYYIYKAFSSEKYGLVLERHFAGVEKEGELEYWPCNVTYYFTNRKGKLLIFENNSSSCQLPKEKISIDLYHLLNNN